MGAIYSDSQASIINPCLVRSAGGAFAPPPTEAPSPTPTPTPPPTPPPTSFSNSGGISGYTDLGANGTPGENAEVAFVLLANGTAAIAQIVDVDFLGLSGSNFVTGGNGKWIKFFEPNGDSVAFWFSTGTESAPGEGLVEIEVVITTSDSASALATALVSAVSAYNGGATYSTALSGDAMQITRQVAGATASSTNDFPGSVTLLNEGAEAAPINGLITISKNDNGSQASWTVAANASGYDEDLALAAGATAAAVASALAGVISGLTGGLLGASADDTTITIYGPANSNFTVSTPSADGVFSNGNALTDTGLTEDPGVPPSGGVGQVTVLVGQPGVVVTVNEVDLTSASPGASSSDSWRLVWNDDYSVVASGTESDSIGSVTVTDPIGNPGAGLLLHYSASRDLGGYVTINVTGSYV